MYISIIMLCHIADGVSKLHSSYRLWYNTMGSSQGAVARSPAPWGRCGGARGCPRSYPGHRVDPGGGLGFMATVKVKKWLVTKLIVSYVPTISVREQDYEWNWPHPSQLHVCALHIPAQHSLSGICVLQASLDFIQLTICIVRNLWNAQNKPTCVCGSRNISSMLTVLTWWSIFVHPQCKPPPSRKVELHGEIIMIIRRYEHARVHDIIFIAEENDIIMHVLLGMSLWLQWKRLQ